jgi:hypothetical protein
VNLTSRPKEAALLFSLFMVFPRLNPTQISCIFTSMILSICFTPEVHWIDLLIHFIFWPGFILLLRYLYFLWRYNNILGQYEGGKSLIEIKLRFLCVFRIECTEAGGQIWEGKSYKINDEGNYLTGLYVWNPKQKDRPDVGEHKLYFSENRSNVKAYWQNLTKIGDGISDWEKVNKNK